jgi:hypothetical protein
MNESTAAEEAASSRPWYRRELFVFIVGSILIAFGLVCISLALYTSSGASLLDLSRPGYQSVQNKLDQTDSFEAFSSDGPVNSDTLTQFTQLFQKQVKPVSNSTDFDSAPLADQALGLDDPQVAPTTP